MLKGTIFAVLLMVFGLSFRAFAQVNVTTWHCDLAHSSNYSQETTLNPTNVSAPGSFGLLFADQLNGQIYAQPLYLSGIKMADGNIHNVVFLATEHDCVYAVDGDSNTGSNARPIWADTLIPTGCTTVPAGEANQSDITDELGITATPVIDTTSNTIYVVTKVKKTSNASYHQYLHALDVTSGAEKFNGPVEIAATFHGNGSPSDTVINGTYQFSALHYHARSALVLYNGIVYITYASHADYEPYHGCILGYNATTLQLVKQFNATPNGIEGGIWQNGAGPAIDGAGNMYFLTGNGSWDQNSSSFTTDTDWGESVLKLPTTGTFDVSLANTLNWFTPCTYDILNAGDLDMASSGPLLLPDQTGGTHPHLLVCGGKIGTLFVIDRDNMSGEHNPDLCVQEVYEPQGVYEGFFCTPSYFNGNIYYACVGDHLRQRSVGYDPATGNYISTKSIASNNVYNDHGSDLSISSNGTSNGLIWITQNNISPSELDVYNATSVAGNPIYSFQMEIPTNPVTYLTANKYNVATVANGKVYLTGFDRNTSNPVNSYLLVLGLVSGATTSPTAPSNLVATPLSSSQVALAWTDNSNNESGFKISRATQSGGPFTQVGLTGTNITTFSDGNLNPQTTYYYQVVATNNIGDSSPTNTASATTFTPFTPTGLLAYWNFDDGAGTVAHDVTGHGYNGTLNGETAWSAPFIGNSAINFHGTGNAVSNVTVPDAQALEFSASQSFTLSAWVKPTLRAVDEAVISKSRETGSYYGIWINSSNQWVFRGGTASSGNPVDVVGTAVANVTWTHVAVVQDGAAGKRYIYVNGVLAGTGTAQAGNGTGNLLIGNATGVTQPFPGDIDEVRLYNRALAPSEITNLMGSPVLQAVSRLSNAVTATDDLALPTNGSVLIEPRQSSPPESYKIVATFSNAVSGISATLSLQSGHPGMVAGTTGTITYDTTGKIVTIPLVGVHNAQALNLHLYGIVPGNGTADIPLNILIGDINGDGSVTSADVSPVRASYGLSFGASGFNIRADTTGDGVVSSADVIPIKTYYGTTVP